MSFETYLTKTIQEAVQEAVRKEFDKFKEEIRRKVKSDTTQRRNKKSDLGDRIIRPKELSQMLSLSIATIYRMYNEDQLPPKILIGSRAVGWLRSDIEEWLISRKQDE